MNRMEASLTKVSAIRVRFSKSLASLRQRPSQAKVRSTTHRFGRILKALGLIGPLDDLHLQLRQYFRDGLLESRPLIAPIGEQLFQEWEQPKQRGKQQDPTIAVLNIGRMNGDVKQ